MVGYIYVRQKAKEQHFKPIKYILINEEQSPHLTRADQLICFRSKTKPLSNYVLLHRPMTPYSCDKTKHK